MGSPARDRCDGPDPGSRCDTGRDRRCVRREGGDPPSTVLRRKLGARLIQTVRGVGYLIPRDEAPSLSSGLAVTAVIAGA